jgi:hypothetical protein
LLSGCVGGGVVIGGGGGGSVGDVFLFFNCILNLTL